jgi:hypothetical protein
VSDRAGADTAAPVVESPTLADAIRRYAAARARARDLISGLGLAEFHRAPAEGAWSVARCLEHLVVSGTKVVARLEAAIERGRAAGRHADPAARRAPVRLGLRERFLLAGTAPGRQGGPPRMRVRTREAFEPGDPAAGRDGGVVLADFTALQDRLERAARAADGLDLAGIRVPSVIAPWLRVGLGAWFLAIAGHQERHLDQAARTRAAVAVGPR